MLLREEDIMEGMSEILARMVVRMNLEAKLRDTRPPLAKICHYICTNITDATFGAGNVAEHFNMTLPAISKYFSSNLGVNPICYIQTMRVEKAKHCLQKDDMTVQEIADLSGFLSTNTFVKTFRRFTGQTPSEYRSFMRNRHESITARGILLTDGIEQQVPTWRLIGNTKYF